MCDKPGQCKQQNKQPQILQNTAIEVASGSKCRYGRFLFCAGGADAQGMPHDACMGDSGGPLECKDKLGKIFACGVVSKGPSKCGFEPGGYVKLARQAIILWLINQGQASTAGRIETNVRGNIEERKESGTSLNSATGRMFILIVLLIFIKEDFSIRS
ncbi:transmembrane protease serine 9-like [Symsagittifera roscoffensis]|uniref:transmembrane protease serine 9-like n=1 Tax=Symsagittifera roscoffensis TaxID=84072 RepID=UPI00307C12DB